MSADVLKDGNTSPFMFDVNFAAPEVNKPVPKIALADHEAALREAEEKGFQRGLAEGKAGEETRLANEAKRIAAAAEKILAAIDLDRVRLEKECASLSLVIARQLSEAAIAHYPLADIEELISQCLGPLRKTPHLVVRLNEKEAESIKETVGKFVKEAGFEGRFVVLGEPDFAAGDCRIEWADGGIVRDREAAFEEIQKIFKNYFFAVTGTEDDGVDAFTAPPLDEQTTPAVKGSDDNE